MNRLARSTWIVILGGAFVPSALGQGETGFLRGEGKADVVYTYAQDTYDHFWVNRDRVEMAGIGRVTRVSHNLYAAFGVLDELDATANVSYVQSSSDGTAGFPREADLQDAEVGAKWRLLRENVGPGRVSLLLAPRVKFPLSNYENNSVTAIGDGQTDYRLRGVAQLELGALYLAIDTGYDVRAGLPRNEFPLHISAGYTLADLVTVSPFYSRVDSLGGINLGEGAFARAEEDFQRLGAQIYVRINDHFGATVGGFTTLAGQNTGDVNNFSLGGVLRF